MGDRMKRAQGRAKELKGRAVSAGTTATELRT
jgi:hypothetical protein